MATNAATFPERGYFLAETARPTAGLQPLFDAIWRSGTTEMLRAEFVPTVAAHFSARRAAVMVFSELRPDADLQTQVRDNPVFRYLFTHHAPVHEAALLTPGDWSALCPWSDHGHVLTGPIIRNGEIIGALALTRARDEAGFAEADLADASALCAHLSAWFCSKAGNAALPPKTPQRAENLTPREHQITELVAQGLTNAQIGARLYVSSETVKATLKSIFRKTGVHSRAQLAARRRV